MSDNAMKFGFGSGRWERPGAPDTIEQAVVAEELGYDHVTWVDVSVLGRDCYVGLASWAANTSRIRVGTGVTHTASRSPVATAMAAATLQELSRGRMFLGLGTGMSGAHTIGRAPADLRTLRETVEIVRRLTAGETVVWDGSAVKSEWAAQRVPVVLAAMGPRAQQLAGEIADGVFINYVHPALVPLALENVRRGTERAGRSPDEIEVWFRTMVAIAEDPADARREVASYAATLAHDFSATCLRRGSPEAREVQRALPDNLRHECLRAAEQYDYRQHEWPDAEHAATLSSDLVSAFTIAGDAAGVTSRIRELRDLGVTRLSFFNASRSGADKVDLLRRFAEDVMPAFP